jgi:hypothetical protein
VDVLDNVLSLEGYSENKHTSHKIFQLKTDPSREFMYAGLDFVSDWVRDKVITLACQREFSQMVKFVRSNAGFGALGTLCDSTFAGLTHILLSKGGEFVVRPLNSRQEEIISLPFLQQKSFIDWEQVQTCHENMYFRPISKTLKAIDSLERPNILFQMTVAKKHPIHAPGLIESIEKLGCSGDIHLYFPLPEDRFKDFVKQNYCWPRIPKIEDASAKNAREAEQKKGNKVLGRVRQFALLIKCSTLELSAVKSLKQTRKRLREGTGVEEQGQSSDDRAFADEASESDATPGTESERDNMMPHQKSYL